MPALMIVRHAKSSWDDPVDDLRRPLSKRGRRACEHQGVVLASLGLEPDLVVTSPAVRAQETAARIGSAAGWTAPVHRCGSLYPGYAEGAMSLLRWGGDADLVALVGHEPLCSELIELITGGLAPRMVTGTVAVLEIDGPWPDLEAGAGVLRMLLPPRLRWSTFA